MLPHHQPSRTSRLLPQPFQRCGVPSCGANLQWLSRRTPSRKYPSARNSGRSRPHAPVGNWDCFQLGRVDDFYLNSLLMGTFGKGFYGSAIEDSLRKKERRSAGTVAGAVERFCSVGGVGAFREVFTNKAWYHTNPNYLEVKFGTKSWQVFNHLVTHHFRRDTVDCSILKVPKDSNQLEELYEPQAQPGSSPGPVHRAMGSDTNRAAVTHAKFPDSVDGYRILGVLIVRILLFRVP